MLCLNNETLFSFIFFSRFNLRKPITITLSRAEPNQERGPYSWKSSEAGYRFRYCLKANVTFMGGSHYNDIHKTSCRTDGGSLWCWDLTINKWTENTIHSGHQMAIVGHWWHRLDWNVSPWGEGTVKNSQSYLNLWLFPIELVYPFYIQLLLA